MSQQLAAQINKRMPNFNPSTPITARMDLLAGVRKEGSRGGRADFKWEDVKDDAHRENYLGHSLKAPVGRWQKNRDLSWYAKANDSDGLSAEEARREEIRRIKEAEQDALSAALGFAVEPRRRGGDNSRMMEEEVKRVVKETATGGSKDEGEGGRGVGFGGGVTGRMGDVTGEVLSGARGEEGGLKGGREKEREREREREREKDKEKHRDRERKKHREHRERRHRSRTPDRDRDRRHHHRRRSRSRSPDRPRRRYTPRSRSRSPDRPRRRHASHSPRRRHYDYHR
ncbi:MAG: hypothetical protein M1839_003295 [Geoglossum umbratile]|nr:MAG: hypothetical protein M1839_003295 [Geoglossum umbratile]